LGRSRLAWGWLVKHFYNQSDDRSKGWTGDTGRRLRFGLTNSHPR